MSGLKYYIEMCDCSAHSNWNTRHDKSSYEYHARNFLDGDISRVSFDKEEQSALSALGVTFKEDG